MQVKNIDSKLTMQHQSPAGPFSDENLNARLNKLFAYKF